MKKKGLCFNCGRQGYRAFECKKNVEAQTQNKEKQMIQAKTESKAYLWMRF